MHSPLKQSLPVDNQLKLSPSPVRIRLTVRLFTSRRQHGEQPKHQPHLDPESPPAGEQAHQVKGGEIIRPPSSARRLLPRGITTSLAAPRWRS